MEAKDEARVPSFDELQLLRALLLTYRNPSSLLSLWTSLGGPCYPPPLISPPPRLPEWLQRRVELKGREKEEDPDSPRLQPFRPFRRGLREDLSRW